VINSRIKQSKTLANEIKTRAESEAKQSNQLTKYNSKSSFQEEQDKE
jgi:hypothetical protein